MSREISGIHLWCECFIQPLLMRATCTYRKCWQEKRDRVPWGKAEGGGVACTSGDGGKSVGEDYRYGNIIIPENIDEDII